LEHIAKDRDFFAMSRSDARASRYVNEEALVVRDGEYFEVFFIGLDWSAVDRCSEARSPKVFGIPAASIFPSTISPQQRHNRDMLVVCSRDIP
jgi:hypothetical protein